MYPVEERQRIRELILKWIREESSTAMLNNKLADRVEKRVLDAFDKHWKPTTSREEIIMNLFAELGGMEVLLYKTERSARRFR